MISNAKCSNQICNICYENMPNYHCNQCTFVICRTCKLAMDREDLNKQCSLCRKYEPWIESYDNIPEIIELNNNHFELNLSIKCKLNGYHNCIKKIIFTLFILLFWIFIGYICTLFDDSVTENYKFPSNILYYLVYGFVVFLLFCVAMLFFTLFLIACCKKQL